MNYDPCSIITPRDAIMVRMGIGLHRSEIW